MTEPLRLVEKYAEDSMSRATISPLTSRHETPVGLILSSRSRTRRIYLAGRNGAAGAALLRLEGDGGVWPWPRVGVESLAFLGDVGQRTDPSDRRWLIGNGILRLGLIWFDHAAIMPGRFEVRNTLKGNMGRCPAIPTASTRSA